MLQLPRRLSASGLLLVSRAPFYSDKGGNRGMKIASSLVALCAVLVLGVASLPMSTGGSAQAATPSFDHSVQVGNASVAPGATT